MRNRRPRVQTGRGAAMVETAVRFHVDNARRKLGAVNRAQAVARLVNQRLI
ncbi:hypothetical protein [Mesorhizobium carmichaelinearum]|uniref:hypothetical protein n=1 Tax=Mesorhizobium carmichaelinearum TaxID=1208188 RepID=UPI0015CBC257|nr:hypothetical protein [Mesorhizobium carmichaelinearum]